MTFRSILVANRGEIACRVMRTAKRMGLRTIAVHSDADREARHVRRADEAYPIGPAPARESYLSIPNLVAAIRASGAEAVHPGYGFLSENAGFAEAVAAAGATFVGPPGSAIRAMGSKSAAKALMVRAGVPVVPGYHGDDQTLTILRAAAEDVGYPVLIKASAGGGGRGMRVVESADDLAAAIDSARREAASAFGDDRLLIEKYLTRPRHIEIQIFADGQGNAVHLFERDCSIQRRHQKVIEEAPAPGMTAERRKAMGDSAVAAARAIGYQGAGTVEFIADGVAFYFMEMNTRLQVEHPVTEMIAGVDLVEWQLRVAAGEPLPLAQDALSISGHAVEARLYAEDPNEDFRPSTGRLVHLRLPREDAHVRVDAGVDAGDAVTVHYDPMIAKIIAWDRDRDGAVRKLQAALLETEVVGVTTNRGFLARIMGHPAFRAAELDTGFIARHRDDLMPAARPASAMLRALAAIHVLLGEAGAAKASTAASADPHSPWAAADGWRIGTRASRQLAFRDGDATVSIDVVYRAEGWTLTIDGAAIVARGERSADGLLVADLDGRRQMATVIETGATLSIIAAGEMHRFVPIDPLAPPESAEAATGRLTAPMPGRIARVLVAEGAAVKRRQPLVVLEAMKMEHTITAPADGIVATLRYREGDLVEEGAELLTLEAGEAKPEATPC